MMSDASTTDRYRDLLFLGDGIPFASRIRDVVGHHRLFGNFSQDDIVRLAPHLACYRAPAGTVILEEGEPGHHLVIVISGLVEVVKCDAEGGSKGIGVVGPGHTLGEMSMLDGKPRSATCIALDDTVFTVLDRASFAHLVEDDPRLANRILLDIALLLTQRLREANMQLVDFQMV
ncbi:MAG: cyclic nucleotide-binding domain-containing protein [Rhodocyclaceae bacterium]|nr:cyclic nucleotide-binding domain-containing protein [Rhodocyclaceae bacterium]